MFGPVEHGVTEAYSAAPVEHGVTEAYSAAGCPAHTLTQAQRHNDCSMPLLSLTLSLTHTHAHAVPSLL